MKKFLIMTAVVVFIGTTVGCNCFPRLFRRGAYFQQPYSTGYSPGCCDPCSDACGPATIDGTTQLGPIANP